MKKSSTRLTKIYSNPFQTTANHSVNSVLSQLKANASILPTLGIKIFLRKCLLSITKIRFFSFHHLKQDMHSVIWYVQEISLFPLISSYLGDVLILLPQAPYWHKGETWTISGVLCQSSAVWCSPVDTPSNRKQPGHEAARLHHKGNSLNHQWWNSHHWWMGSLWYIKYKPTSFTLNPLDG